MDAARAQAAAATAADDLKVSGATLIVTPATIAPQWEAELSKHAATLKWRRYEGSKAAGSSSPSAEALSKCDVLLCTYDVLSQVRSGSVQRGATLARREPPSAYASTCASDSAISRRQAHGRARARVLPRERTLVHVLRALLVLRQVVRHRRRARSHG